MKAIKINSMWCPSCLIMNPIFEEIVQELNIKIISLDYDLDDTEVAKYEIGKILPVIIFFDDNNKEIIRFIGEKKKTEMLAKLKGEKLKWRN